MGFALLLAVLCTIAPTGRDVICVRVRFLNVSVLCQIHKLSTIPQPLCTQALSCGGAAYACVHFQAHVCASLLTSGALVMRNACMYDALVMYVCASLLTSGALVMPYNISSSNLQTADVE